MLELVDQIIAYCVPLTKLLSIFFIERTLICLMTSYYETLRRNGGSLKKKLAILLEKTKIIKSNKLESVMRTKRRYRVASRSRLNLNNLVLILFLQSFLFSICLSAITHKTHKTGSNLVKGINIWITKF